MGAVKGKPSESSSSWLNCNLGLGGWAGSRYALVGFGEGAGWTGEVNWVVGCWRRGSWRCPLSRSSFGRDSWRGCRAEVAGAVSLSAERTGFTIGNACWHIDYSARERHARCYGHNTINHPPAFRTVALVAGLPFQGLYFFLSACCHKNLYRGHTFDAIGRGRTNTRRLGIGVRCRKRASGQV